MSLKFDFSLIIILILCSFHTVLTEDIGSNEDSGSDSDYSDSSSSSEESSPFTTVLIPPHNLSISLEKKSTDREKLFNFVIQETEQLAQKNSGKSPLKFRHEIDYTDDDDYYYITTIDQEAYDTDEDIPLPSQMSTACQNYLNNVLKACEKFWNSLSPAEKVMYHEFNEWLNDFKITTDIIERMDAINDFFIVI